MNPTAQTLLEFRDARKDTPFWNPKSGVFDGGQLRMVIVIRGWTVQEFAQVAKVSAACLYNALRGHGVTDRTAIRIFTALALRQPVIPLPDVPRFA